MTDSVTFKFVEYKCNLSNCSILRIQIPFEFLVFKIIPVFKIVIFTKFIIYVFLSRVNDWAIDNLCRLAEAGFFAS